ncbi:dynamin-2 [Trichonephila inaurata madagascariensis]|uniref:Dynamin-2 n=1 Tax=Trichonephila inaurata madagascariensis TaxID=2747483 RepID=A0A8X6WVW8_9ARAC|nr:dynamin-2 [Trichonephila inaurata madagascariensis]
MTQVKRCPPLSYFRSLFHPNAKLEYAIFGHKEDEKFTDFKAVKAEIAAQMPPKYKFSSVPIQVKIYSPRVLKLTLVDLPGLVRVVVDGQPESSILEVRDMILSYIKQPESLILAVSPANQDLATSDAIEIARTVDPQRLRTIGVLTKLDIMDEGTDARDVLENRQVTLKRGWVGVLNRSQLDIDEGRDIQYILDREKRFFLEKACYRLVNTFIEDVSFKLLGNSEMVDMRSTFPLAFINYKLNTEKLEPNEEDMTVLITNLHGIRGSISFPSLSLDAVNRKLVTQYEYPLEQSVECIRKVLEEAILESSEMLNSYPATKAELIFRIRRCLQKESEATILKLREHVQAEMFYVNLEHPDMDLSVCDPVVPAVGPTKVWVATDSSKGATAELEMDNSTGDGLSERSKHLVKVLMQNESTQKKVQYLMLVMTKYMEIVQKQIADLTVKYILCFLVKKVLDYIKVDLVPTLLELSNFASLTDDCEEDFRLKEEMEAACMCLKDALDAIQAF